MAWTGSRPATRAPPASISSPPSSRRPPLIAVVMGGKSAGARDRLMDESDRGPYRGGSPVRTAPMIAERLGRRGRLAGSCARRRPGAPRARARRSDGCRPRSDSPKPSPTPPKSVGVTLPTRRAPGHSGRRGQDDLKSRDVPEPVARAAESSSRAVQPPRLRCEPSVPADANRLRRAVPARLGWDKRADSVGQGRARPHRRRPARTARAADDRGPLRTTIEDASPAPGRLDHPDRRDRRRRQGQGAAGEGPPAAPGAAGLGAKPFTEKIRKGGDTLYRARFAGLEAGVRPVRLPIPQEVVASPASRSATERPPRPPLRSSSGAYHPCRCIRTSLASIDPRGKRGRPPMIWMKFLHERAMRPRDVFAPAPSEAQGLRKLLLGHCRARARSGSPRASPRPASACTPAGKPAVEVSL